MDIRLNGINPLSYMGVNPLSPAPTIIRSYSPTSSDFQGLVPLTIWLNKAALSVWILVSVAKNSGTWIELTDGSSGTINQINTDAGNVVPAAGIITIDGGSNISTSGTGSTVTINLDDAVTIIGAFSAESITAFGGDIVASGNVTAVSGQVIGGSITSLSTIASSGDITASSGGSISAAGSITAGTGLSVSAGNIVALAGSLSLPSTNTAGTQGVIFVNASRFISSFGTRNIFIGTTSGNTTLTGTDNVGLGIGTLTALTTSVGNVALGSISLQAITTGLGRNTAVGDAALFQLVTGIYNTCLGRASGGSYTGSESGNIILGSSSGTVGESDVMRLGNDSTISPTTAKTFISGVAGVTTDVMDAVPVLISASTGQLGTVSSSRRYKENIFSMSTESDVIHNMRPVVFNYKKDASKTIQYGLVAEEVAKVSPRLAIYDSEGNPETVKYQDLVPLLLNELIKLTQRVHELEKILIK